MRAVAVRATNLGRMADLVSRNIYRTQQQKPMDRLQTIRTESHADERTAPERVVPLQRDSL